MPKRVEDYIAVNVDWDFFFKEDSMWDWGHRESSLFLEAAWQWRFEQFLGSQSMGGRDLEQFYQPNILYKSFWEELQRLGFDFSDALFLIGESNLGAWSSFANMPVSHVYNFDFHHDVAYEDLGKRVDCGNWLGQLLREKKRLTATIVYPTKERQADEFHLPESVETLIGSKIQATTFRALEEAPRKVRYLFICRSGSWTPPWADDQFLGFIGQAPSDSKPIWYAELLHNEKADLANPLVPRVWDRAAAVEQAEQYQKLIKEIKSRR